MRAGLLRHRVSLQALTQTIVAGGGFSEAWSHVSWRRLSITPLTGTELVNAQQIVEKVLSEIKEPDYKDAPA